MNIKLSFYFYSIKWNYYAFDSTVLFNGFCEFVALSDTLLKYSLKRLF